MAIGSLGRWTERQPGAHSRSITSVRPRDLFRIAVCTNAAGVPSVVRQPLQGTDSHRTVCTCTSVVQGTHSLKLVNGHFRFMYSLMYNGMYKFMYNSCLLFHVQLRARDIFAHHRKWAWDPAQACQVSRAPNFASFWPWTRKISNIWELVKLGTHAQQVIGRCKLTLRR